MMDDQMLNIAKAFSPFPAGRIPADGDFNGETFRTSYLEPKLRQAIDVGAKLTVSLDGLKSCGSSFLESAFGGLVRYNGFSQATLNNFLVIECSTPALERYKIAANRYIQKAKAE